MGTRDTGEMPLSAERGKTGRPVENVKGRFTRISEASEVEGAGEPPTSVASPGCLDRAGYLMFRVWATEGGNAHSAACIHGASWNLEARNILQGGTRKARWLFLHL